jgi:hypothetical protein
MELIAGLFGGFGAVVLWEGFVKRRITRRQVARLLFAEIHEHLHHLQQIVAKREQDPMTFPTSWPANPAYSAIGAAIGEFPTALIVKIVAYYRTLETISSIIKEFDKDPQNALQLGPDFDGIAKIALLASRELLVSLGGIAGGGESALLPQTSIIHTLEQGASSTISQGHRIS